MKLKVKRVRKNAILPRKAHLSDAAFDVFVPEDTVIKIGRNIVPLGVAIELPLYHQAMIEARSGMSSKGMEVHVCGKPERVNADIIPGKIDSGYRGEIKAIVKSSAICTIKAGTRIAQMTITEIAHIDECEEVIDLLDSDRQNNGFGSTGSA